MAQQQKTKDAFKYISIYRKALRNSQDLSGSRTDLKDLDGNNDYEQNLMKTNCDRKVDKSEFETDLLPTEHSHHNMSARDNIQILNEKESVKGKNTFLFF